MCYEGADYVRYFRHLWSYNKAKGYAAQIRLAMEFENGDFKKHRGKLVSDCWLTSPKPPDSYKFRLATFVHDHVRKIGDGYADPERLLKDAAGRFYAISEFLSNAAIGVSFATASSSSGKIDFGAIMRGGYSWLDWRTFLYENERFREIRGEDLLRTWGDRGRTRALEDRWYRDELKETLLTESHDVLTETLKIILPDSWTEDLVNMPPDRWRNASRADKRSFVNKIFKKDAPLAEVEKVIKGRRNDDLDRKLRAMPCDFLKATLLKELFYEGYMKSTLRNSPSDPYDVDGFVVSRSHRYIFPIELKEKYPTKSKHFGLDTGRILMLLRLCVPNGCNALYIVRETDEETGCFAGWKYTTLANILMSSSWNPQGGGTGMGGQSTYTVMIPYNEFSDVTESTFDDDSLKEMHNLSDDVMRIAAQYAGLHADRFFPKGGQTRLA